MPLKRTKNFKRREPLFKRLKRTLASKRTKMFFKSVLSLVLVASVYFAGKRFYEELLTSPLLQIKKIDVAGIKKISRDELLEMAKLHTGDNILAVDTNNMAVNIKKHPWVEAVRIRRKMPDRLILEVKERDAAAFINMDELYLIDNNGIVFKKASLEDNLDLPVINTGISKDELEDNEKVSSLIMDAVFLIKLLKDRETFNTDNLSEIKVDPVYGLTLYAINSGIRIEMGFDNFNKKLERLTRILNELNDSIKYVEAVNMNYGKRVVVQMFGS